MFHPAFPVNKKGHAGAHQENRTDHTDCTPASGNDCIEYLADKQEAQAGGNTFCESVTAFEVFSLQQADQRKDSIKQDEDEIKTK